MLLFQPVHHKEGLSVMNATLLLLGEMAGIGLLGLPKALADTGKMILTTG